MKKDKIDNRPDNPYESTAKKAVLTDVLIVFLTLVSARFLAQEITWIYGGPISLAIAFVVAHFRLRKRGFTWKNLGLNWQRSAWKLMLYTTCTFASLLVIVFIGHWIAGQFFERPEPSPRFANVPGNLSITLSWIALGWIIGGFGEELIYRGFFISALERLFSNTIFKQVIAILLPGVFWAARHTYFHGYYGGILVFLMSILFGSFYFLWGRNLWPLILTHGLADTISFVGRYFDEY
jgi:membrane protease YdiL (CAAX protease family)